METLGCVRVWVWMQPGRAASLGTEFPVVKPRTGRSAGKIPGAEHRPHGRSIKEDR